MAFGWLFGKNDVIGRIIGVLTKLSTSLLALSDNQRLLSERYLELHASHELLAARYNELATQLVQQQATNAELYGNILMIAQAIRGKGLDVTFPLMEFEIKNPQDPGAN